MKQLMTTLISVSCVVALAVSTAGEQPTPQGFTDDFRVFIATGLIDNAEQPDPPFVNCFNALCDGDYFHKVVMGRSDEELAALDQLAKAFYLQRVAR